MTAIYRAEAPSHTESWAVHIGEKEAPLAITSRQLSSPFRIEPPLFPFIAASLITHSG